MLFPAISIAASIILAVTSTLGLPIRSRSPSDVQHTIPAQVLSQRAGPVKPTIPSSSRSPNPASASEQPISAGFDSSAVVHNIIPRLAAFVARPRSYSPTGTVDSFESKPHLPIPGPAIAPSDKQKARDKFAISLLKNLEDVGHSDREACKGKSVTIKFSELSKPRFFAKEVHWTAAKVLIPTTWTNRYLKSVDTNCHTPFSLYEAFNSNLGPDFEFIGHKETDWDIKLYGLPVSNACFGRCGTD